MRKTSKWGIRNKFMACVDGMVGQVDQHVDGDFSFSSWGWVQESQA